MYVVVLFEDDNGDCVECVPTSWVEGDKCYWPGKNVQKKIKNKSLPDKGVWKKYKMRKLGHEYKDYDTAMKYRKKAEETSNLDSDDDSRRRKRPSRYISSDNDCESDGAADDECDQNEDTPSKTRRLRVPSPPRSVENPGNGTSALQSLDKTPPAGNKKQLDGPPQPETLPQASSPVRNRQTSSEVRRSPRNKSGGTRLFGTPRQITVESSSSTSGTCITEDSQIQEKNKGTSEILQQILSKLESVENEIKFIRQNMTVEEGDLESVEDILPGGEKLDSPESVQDFEDGLDDHKRKKLIASLAALQGGSDGGAICRTIMRSLMTNNVMSKFSGTGQKGKLPFIGKPIYKIILSAARKASKKTISFKEFKTEVLDVLRNSPNKPGGANYIKKKGQRRPPARDEFPNESDCDE